MLLLLFIVIFFVCLMLCERLYLFLVNDILLIMLFVMVIFCRVCDLCDNISNVFFCGLNFVLEILFKVN